MSRSRKKVPIHWVCMPRNGQMKKWKQRMSRRFRRNPMNDEISNGSVYRRVSGDLWDSPSDGRSFCDIKDDPNECRRVLGK